MFGLVTDKDLKALAEKYDAIDRDITKIRKDIATILTILGGENAKYNDIFARFGILQGRFDKLKDHVCILDEKLDDLMDSYSARENEEQKLREGIQNILDYDFGVAREAIKQNGG